MKTDEDFHYNSRITYHFALSIGRRGRGGLSARRKAVLFGSKISGEVKEGWFVVVEEFTLALVISLVVIIGGLDFGCFCGIASQLLRPVRRAINSWAAIRN